MTAFGVVRLVANVALLVFSLIVLGLSANLLSKKGQWISAVPGWFGFTLFVSIISLLVGGVVLVVNRLRNGAVTGMVAVELLWTGILGLFWLSAAGAQSTSLLISSLSSCSFSNYDYGLGDLGLSDSDLDSLGLGSYKNAMKGAESICHQFKAVQAFSWLNWLLLWGWMVSLLILSIVAYTRGNRSVFTAPAGDTDFFARDDTNKPAVYAQTQYPQTTYPPAQQFSPAYGQTPAAQPVAQV
ncbi:hypothetical protein BKA62DRAFT_643902 [Auriculariales sp. MPI-PUGE-AT-0066]|nr:hypothetical protein BKA62DRAFT_643902 [Auriculariales sp. MPI-PUGE-AT-0066]